MNKYGNRSHESSDAFISVKPYLFAHPNPINAIISCVCVCLCADHCVRGVYLNSGSDRIDRIEVTGAILGF